MSTMTPTVAMQQFAVDLAKRAAHTFWQAFVAAFGVAYAASGLDVTQIVDFSTGQKFLSGLLVAVGAAVLSAVKTVVKGLGDAKYQPQADAPAESDEDVTLAAQLADDPDADLPADEHRPEHAAPDA